MSIFVSIDAKSWWRIESHIFVINVAGDDSAAEFSAVDANKETRGEDGEGNAHFDRS